MARTLLSKGGFHRDIGAGEHTSTRSPQMWGLPCAAAVFPMSVVIAADAHQTSVRGCRPKGLPTADAQEGRCEHRHAHAASDEHRVAFVPGVRVPRRVAASFNDVGGAGLRSGKWTRIGGVTATAPILVRNSRSPALSGTARRSPATCVHVLPRTVGPRCARKMDQDRGSDDDCPHPGPSDRRSRVPDAALAPSHERGDGLVSTACGRPSLIAGPPLELSERLPPLPG